MLQRKREGSIHRCGVCQIDRSILDLPAEMQEARDTFEQYRAVSTLGRNNAYYEIICDGKFYLCQVVFATAERQESCSRTAAKASIEALGSKWYIISFRTEREATDAKPR